MRRQKHRSWAFGSATFPSSPCMRPSWMHWQVSLPICRQYHRRKPSGALSWSGADVHFQQKNLLVLTTGNKSELAVGYSTLYGDMAGGFDVLKDCPKMLVYALARYRNTPVSASRSASLRAHLRRSSRLTKRMRTACRRMRCSMRSSSYTSRGCLQRGLSPQDSRRRTCSE